ncbi:MAG TPA: TonB-dependent receptor [Steroidobacteraceae bacterium]|nr:TonB-dependent receptor [Steroidobacteraceae bacterium]
MSKHDNPILAGIAIVAGALALPLAAAAADQGAGAADQSATSQPADASTLETVTVTAQRREQNLQNVPIAVTAFTADQLATRQITSTQDLERYVPNMFASNNVGQGSANVYYIRGLGQTQSFPTFEPQVSTYIDDIYIARQNANNFALFGVQQLQVLNGPQGTLFGRNSTGGAILVTLKKPGRHFGGDAEVSAGEYGESGGYQYLARAAVDLPISGDLLTRTSVYGITGNGYVHDVTTNQRLNGTNNFGLREALALLPATMSNLRWDVAFDYERNNNANVLNQPGPDGRRISYSGFSTIGGALRPYLTGLKSGFGQGAIVTSYGVSSDLALTLGGGTLNLITGYRRLHQDLAADFPAAVLGPLPTADAVPTGEITLAQDLANHQFSQEVKWTDRIGDSFNYTAGAFYLYEQNGNDYGQVLGLAPTLALPLNDQFFKNDTTSVAAYAQGDYKVTPAFTATVGVRFTDETKNVVANPNAPGLGYTTADIQAVGYPTHLKTNQFTPHVALQYQFNPDLMAFVSATRGFQGGGWNGLTGTNPIDFNNFGPETIWSYEAGIRSTPYSRLRFNATVFYEDVKDYQLLSDNPHTRSFDTSNAASLYAYGLEAELEWRPIDPLTISGNLSSMKAGYYDQSALILSQQAACRAGDPESCNSGIVRADGSLATPVYTPPLDLTVSARYTLGFDGFSITPYVGVHYVAKEWFDTANTAGFSASYPNVGGQTKARTLLDASVAWALAKVPLTVTLECRNCTMVDYGTADLLGFDYFNTPGMWDVRVDYQF